MTKNESQFNKHVQLSIESGVTPLELVYYPIVTMDGNNPIGFRSSTVIHSVLYGDLNEDKYLHITDNRAVGIELLKHNLQHAINSLKAFDKAKKRCDFITVRCPSQMVEKTSLYDIVKGVLEENSSIDPSRLCVEFPEDLVNLNAERVQKSVLDLKILKVKTALQGVGKEEFKISKLVSIPVDLAILDKTASEWAGSRNKPQLFNSLLSYIKAMGADSIAIGNEAEKKEMHFSEAIGFMFEGTDPISKEEAINMAEEADL